MERYEIIVNVLCKYYNFDNENLKVFLSKKENKYIYLLLMKEFNCFYRDKLKRDLSLTQDRSIISNLRKAEEKLLVNKAFRVEYFSIGERVEKIF